MGFTLTLTSCATDAGKQAINNEDSQREVLAQEVKDEVTIGRAMAAKLIGNFGYYENDKAQDYVSMVGQTLAIQVGRTELKFYFSILNSDEVNAFATPGGYIFITKGLLHHLQDESELASCLAHEIAHVNEKHMYEVIRPKREITAGETLARILSRGGSDIGGSLSKIVNQGLEMLLKTGLGKEKEYAADQAGVTYSSTLGYNPYSLYRLLSRIDESKSDLTLPETHPPYQERLQTLKAFLASNGLKDRLAGNSTILNKRFSEVKR